MSADEIRKHITAVPFRPFTLHVADGRQVPVIARDFILMSPSRRVIHVVQPDDHSDYLNYLLITGISVAPPAPSAPPHATTATNS